MTAWTRKFPSRFRLGVNEPDGFTTQVDGLEETADRMERTFASLQFLPVRYVSASKGFWAIRSCSPRHG